MRTRSVSRCIVAIGLLTLVTPLATAQVIDDHFTADSGGITA